MGERRRLTGSVSCFYDPKGPCKERLPAQNMCDMWPAIRVAKEMGARLGQR